MADAKPSDLEMQVLGVLWDRGPSAVREVLDAMPDGKRRAYTTVLSVLQVMEKKGLVTHTQRGAAHVFEAAVTRRRVLGPFLRGLVANVFGGRPAAAMQQLLAEADVSDQELAEIRDLLDRVERSRRPGVDKG